METPENLISTELQIDNNAYLHLKETAGWAKFLGIVGFVFSALIGIIAFVVPAYLKSSMSSNPYGNAGAGMFSMMSGFITVLYLILAIMGFFISLFAYKFGVKTKLALQNTDQESLDKGLMNLKFLFRFHGIIMIIYLGFITLAIIGGVVGSMMSR
ncbi:MAG: hypothetical protein ACKVOM_08560 [Ferruginibacter sp.]